MDRDSILELSVEGLKSKLRELNLQTSGLKNDLRQRLFEHYNIQVLEEINIENEQGIYEEAFETPSVSQPRSVESPTMHSHFTLRDIQDSMSYFDGTNRPSIDTWVQEFENGATVVGWNNIQKFIFAKQLLKGAAQSFVRSQAQINDWVQLKNALIEEFRSELNTADIHKILLNKRKRKTQSHIEFLYELMEIAKPINLDEQSIIHYFTEGINDERIYKAVLYEAKTIKELKDKIKIYEKIRGNQRQENFKGSFKSNVDRNFKKYCANCPHLFNHATEECKKVQNVCFKCNQKGHKAAQCRSNTQTENTQRHTNNTQTENTQRYTNNNQNRNNNNQQYTKNKDNNTQKNANNRNNELEPINSNQYQTRLSFATNRMVKQCEILNCKFEAMIDSGSDLTLMAKSVYDQLENPILFSESIRVNGIGNGLIKTLGHIVEVMKIDNIEFSWTFHIVEDKDIMALSLIGNDVLDIVDILLTKNGATLILKEKQKNIEDILFEKMLGTREEECEPTFEAGIEFRTLCTEQTIEYNFQVGCKSDPKLKKLEMNLAKMIDNYKPNKTENTNVRMKIILKDDIPIYQRPRRISYEDQKIVEKQIDDWLKEGIVKKSQSEYASPIVIVAKKDGSKRICCDYRKINEKMIRDNFPMVLIDDVLGKLQSAKIYTTLDLKNGFFHVPIEENSQKYTAIVTHHGQFEFLRTPFGLSNSPAVFCRFIAAVFHDFIQDGTIVIYMDDLVIPSQTSEENLEKLKKVLEVASKNGLEINWKKCQCLNSEITFLGYIITNGTIQPSNEKVKAVDNFPIPSNHKALQRFLGLTSYFRRFIPNYSIIAKPLTDQLKKEVKFQVNNEQLMAIQQLKQALTNSPVLKIFNPQAETEIHTDASMYGYGAALLQKDSEDGQWHPIEFMSRKTTEVEQKYHSYELEVLAIVKALTKWRCYVQGMHFKIVTDCNAFTQTLKKQDVPMRIQRWTMFLQDYNFDIEHRVAAKLKHVDALSRVYCFMIQSSLKHRIIEAQDTDNWVKTTKQLVSIEPYKDYYVKNKILYKDPAKELIVIPSCLETEIIEMAHNEGHFSTKKTQDIVMKNFYIPQLNEKTNKIVNNCVQCIIANAKAGKKDGYLNPIESTSAPLETLHIDHVGPLDKTQKQYNHILTIVDSFSKFIWLFPTKSTGTSEVLKILQKIATIFGNPKNIVTDRGTAFTSQDFTKYCQDEDINHILITTGVPRANGQVERMHKIVLSLLTKLSYDKPNAWYKYLPKIQQTINSSVTRSTKNTPFNILTGLNMRINNTDKIKELLSEEEINILNSEGEDIRIKAKQNILKIAEENRKTFNKKRKPENEYEVGNLVAIKRTQFGTNLKVKAKYLGPYKVVEKKRLGRYKVEKVGEQEGPKTTSTIAEYMKPWSQ